MLKKVHWPAVSVVVISSEPQPRGGAFGWVSSAAVMKTPTTGSPVLVTTVNGIEVAASTVAAAAVTPPSRA